MLNLKFDISCEMSASLQFTWHFKPYHGPNYSRQGKKKTTRKQKSPRSNCSQLNSLIRDYTCIYLLTSAQYYLPGRLAQSVMCLATDACLTADPGVASVIPVRSHTFVEIDHEMISTVILLPSADSFKKGCCQLQAKVCAQITG